MSVQAANVGDGRPNSKYDRLIAAAKAIPPAATLVVQPCDESSLRGTVEASEAGLITPTLVGPTPKIRDVASKHGIDISRFEIVNAPHSEAAAARAVELIHEAKGEMLMKGSLHTDELIRSVTAKTGLRTERRISHVFVMDVPSNADTVFITDAAINIFPDLDGKRDIIQNAIDLFTQAGFGTQPRVAILSAVETVTSKIPSTIEAAALCKMADRGQITGGLLDGPLAFDNAVDKEAARIKGIKSEVAGRAQILVVPDLEAGNAYFAKADGAGIVLGARVPIVLTSRADSLRARLASCAVATLYADARRRRAATAA
jgi:phosphate acetyltransferase